VYKFKVNLLDALGFVADIQQEVHGYGLLPLPFLFMGGGEIFWQGFVKAERACF